ncbi:MAG TPA: hypothetical protein VFO10_19075 [Oligoflexus sp.]|uniref:hypothetical protein n=1 Tax=Oligoflexus sp. TaxID=1971216 RepID=UPI002D7F0D05|nr:hypothetical protein [Oligoflexus sp.]HET9239372.1 hypothetical protein [Oligoflexus sp.]
MMQPKSHSRQVELWVEQRLKDRPHEAVIDAFNKAFQRVWEKAELILGRVTMQAVADRIVHVGRQDYPWLAPVRSKQDGIDVTALVHKTDHIQDDELRKGLGFLLAEFLRVLGHLTADIISSKLQTALMEDPHSLSQDPHSPSVKGEKS